MKILPSKDMIVPMAIVALATIMAINYVSRMRAAKASA